MLKLRFIFLFITLINVITAQKSLYFELKNIGQFNICEKDQFSELFYNYILNILPDNEIYDINKIWKELESQIVACNPSQQSLLQFYKFEYKWFNHNLSIHEKLKLGQNYYNEKLQADLTKSDSSNLTKLFTFIGNDYLSLGHYSESLHFLNKSHLYNGGYNFSILPYVLRSELALGPTEQTYEKIKIYDEYERSQTSFNEQNYWYNINQLNKVKYFSFKNRLDLCESYLSKIHPNFIESYPFDFYNIQADTYNHFNQKKKELLALKTLEKKVKGNQADGEKLIKIKLGEFYLNQKELALAKKYFQNAKSLYKLKKGNVSYILDELQYSRILLGLAEINLINNNKIAKLNLFAARDILINKFNNLVSRNDKLILLESYSKFTNLIFKYRDKLNLHEENLLKYLEQGKSFGLLDGFKTTRFIQN